LKLLTHTKKGTGIQIGSNVLARRPQPTRAMRTKEINYHEAPICIYIIRTQ
jgi:hypothetical protein